MKRWQCTKMLYQSCCDRYECILNQGDDQCTRRLSIDFAATYNNMANVYYNQGKNDEALTMYEKSLSIRLKKLGDDHPDVAATYNNMANVYYNQGKNDEALAMYENLCRSH